MRRPDVRPWLALTTVIGVGCATSGSAWISEPMTQRSEGPPSTFQPPPGTARATTPAPHYRVRVIGGEREQPEERQERVEIAKTQGRVLGTFRNTYYDFPSEREHSGDPVALYNSKCEAVAKVPKGFHDAVCVQGSGLLASGQTVSFARRDCSCAEVCPRTGHRICYDALDTAQFPWGRGALGKAITPLLTIAVDSNVIPLEVSVYIPEFDGVPVDPDATALHDGCFIAQDRGSRIQGKHVDIFTGHGVTTSLWNRLVPSNGGVTVVLESPRCQR